MTEEKKYGVRRDVSYYTRVDFATVTENDPTFPPKVSLAMSYVPYQRFENLYDEGKALSRGTLFACLDLPFYGSGRGRG